jgi:hypothetical protein
VSKHENLQARKKTRKTPISAAPVTYATWVQLREISWVHYGKSCNSIAICHKNVATREARKVSRARAPDSPMSAEHMDV